MKFKSLFILCSLLIVASYSIDPVLAEDKNFPSGRMIPKLQKTANDPELFNGHVYPSWGPPCQRYTYSVIYSDKEGRAPEYMQIYFNGEMINMEKENPNDNDYKKGVKYIYQNVPNKVASNFYYFEASNGLGKARDSIIDSPDNGPVLFTTAFDKNEISVIEKSSGKKVLNFPTGKEWVGGIALSDNGKYLAAKTSKHIYFFDTTKPNEPLWSFNCEQCPVGGDVKGGVDISADGSKIVAAFGEKVALFDKAGNQPIWTYNKAGNSYNVAISANGEYAAAATAGEEANVNTNLIILWNTQNSKPLWQYHASGNFHDVSLSGDGKYVVGSTGCPDRRFYLFSKDSNEPLIRSELLTRDSPVHRAKISADGMLAAIGSESDAGAVFLFSKDQGQVWKFSTPQGSSVRALNFTPDGKYIGASTFGGDAYIFNSNSNSPVAAWKVNASLGGLDIADDGSFIAAGGTDNKLHIFDRDSKGATEISFSEYVEEVDISANGEYIAAGTGGSVYFFETYISPDREKIFDCSQIIEPVSESGTTKESSQNNNNLSTQVNSQVNKKMPGMLFGFGFLLSFLSLSFYLIVIKFHFFSAKLPFLLRFNAKKVIIILMIIAGIFLILTVVSFIYNQPVPEVTKPNENMEINTNNVIENNNDQSTVSEPQSGECGNGLCEPDYGESKNSCSQDCSAGN